MSYTILDMDNYRRRAHFDYFRSLLYPYAGITVNVDVSDALRYSKQYRRSFYLTFLHAAALAADGVKELRQRIRGEQIVEYDECPTSHIELLEDSSYCYCTIRHHMDIQTYFEQAEEARKQCAQNGITEDQAVESMYFVSTVPWLNYTALIQPVGGEESNPRITWGKYVKDDEGKIVMPVSILAHHALVDGIHFAQFYKNLEDQIRKFGILL
ncbi:MAG: hypothetical protein IKP86_08460 [Anaerolineaceae bacterium]|nr:hypothetical protein [Anaerolineaceae bacterium]